MRKQGIICDMYDHTPQKMLMCPRKVKQLYVTQ